ncbi:MAG: hypothetical protein AAF899_08980 [Pseudomonadota bacterium]
MTRSRRATIDPAIIVPATIDLATTDRRQGAMSMVLAVIFLFLGFAIGWWRARRRGGKRSDKIQMGLAHAIPMGILGFALAITAVNMGL